MPPPEDNTRNINDAEGDYLNNFVPKYDGYEPNSPEWENAVDNINERMVENVWESPDGLEICITYRAENTPNNRVMPDDHGIGWRPPRGHEGVPWPSFNPGDYIGDEIKREFEERFEGGRFTVCHRRARPANLPAEPTPPLPQPDNSNNDFQPTENRQDLNLIGWTRTTWQSIYESVTNSYYGRDGDAVPGGYHSYTALPESRTFDFLSPIAVINRREATYFGTTVIGWSNAVIVLCYGWRSVNNPSSERTYEQPTEYRIGGTGGYFNNYRQFEPQSGISVHYIRSGTTISGLNFERPDDNDKNKRPPIDQLEAMNDCCAEILKELRDIKERVIRIERWTGADKGGMQVPEHLQDNSPGSNWLTNIWDAITPDKKRHIHNIPEFFQWYIEKFQETFGILPLIIKDESDSELGFPNFKYAIEGILNKLAKQDKALGTLQLGLAKTIVELALTRQSVLMGNSYGESITTFLDLNLEEKLVEITHQLSIPEDNDIDPKDVDTDEEMLALLKSSKFLAKVFEFDPRKKLANGKTPITFGSTAYTVEKLWEAYQTANGIGIDKNNIHNGLRSALTALRLFSAGKDLLGKPINDRGAPGWENDLSLWANEVERAFSTINNPPRGSTEEPWGNPPTERPEIIIRGNPPTEGDDM